ncbi:MAG: HD domain-containing phosphohydrolase [Acidimicrobiia bacterium]
MSLCNEAGFDAELRDTVYWVSLMRYMGCTGHAHEVATIFGDEIAIRAQTLVHDAGNPAEVMRDVMAFATEGHPPEAREQIVQAIQQGAHDWAVHNFASGCEVGDMLVHRLDFGDEVRHALAYTFERWSGTGFPNGAKGEEIPLAMRIVHLTHDMEAIARRFSPADAIAAASDRRDRTYDPVLADLFVQHGPVWLDQLSKVDPWDAVLEREPMPHRLLDDDIDDALLVVADFIDLKSPYMAGHSRRCAQLAGDAAELIGSSADEVHTVRRAALVHDFGTTAIPNSMWDKAGPLTRSEFDRVQLHTMLTEQMLRRSPALAALNPIASAHHERSDGSGYHKGLSAPDGTSGAGLLAAADVYVGLTTERADRPAFSGAHAASEIRQLAARAALDGRCADAVLGAAGHELPGAPRTRRVERPAGLSKREVEVLCLAAKGLTTRQIADRLFISPKTTDHHIQHTYTKIGVSTRAAAALWAMQNNLISL